MNNAMSIFTGEPEGASGEPRPLWTPVHGPVEAAYPLGGSAGVLEVLAIIPVATRGDRVRCIVVCRAGSVLPRGMPTVPSPTGAAWV